MNPKRLLYILFALLPLCLGAQTARYAEVLTTYVDDNGMVDYTGLLAHREGLDLYLESLAQPTAQMQQDESAQIAFWINAYNARTLQVILDHYPIQKTRLFYPKNSIRQIPGAWDELTIPVQGQARTLEEMEHEILRKQFREPRIHMALVCAAKSCPRLRNEPYDGERLNDQLDDQSRDFLSREHAFKLDGKRIYISPIFKWFKDDFESVPQFLERYTAVNAASLKIKYQDYDWSLNEQ